MTPRVSVVVPVKDGARYLEELCAAVLAQSPHELLVIDSGSSDGSVQIARRAGADVLEIPAESFGHGRTRNLGAERTGGELICFLTQDATPVPGWLDAYARAFAADPRLGAAYGPHLARPDTSPMIARELEEFFAVQDAHPDFLSNVNACYRRACWEEIRFEDVPYAEDQAFGRALRDTGWRKAYLAEAAVLHAHDYPPLDFMRRYFDEYRGLRATVGHVEPLSLKGVRAQVRGDRQWLRAQGEAPTLAATARSALHHGGRRVFSALGSRADRLPPAVQRAISLEGTAAVPAVEGPPSTQPVPARGPGHYDAVLKVARDGPAPLLAPVPGMSERDSLHLAVVIPPFRRGSGGHNSIFQMLSRLERAGHTITIWLHDPEGWQSSEWPAVAAQNVRDYFAPLEAPVFKGFDSWFGADVVVATGWQTVHPAMLLDNARARVYLVHDHESEFYATSAERWFAESTYDLGLHAICASPWLAEIVEQRYGGSTSPFDFGVDHDVYFPRDVERRRDTVVFYARHVTPRRAVPLGVLALEELKRRRPDVRAVLFGDTQPLATPFDHEHLGIASPEQLAWTYSQGTVGLCLSATNYSLIPQEMLACGMPCVDLAGISAESVFGKDGPVELAAIDPLALADAMERLLDDEALWRRRSEAGRAFVRGRTWDRAAEQVEAGIRAALRERE